MVVPPSPYMSNMLNLKKWTDNTINTIRRYSDRPIEISTKKTPLIVNNKIWCVVSCMSNVITKCLIKGVPVITTHFSKIGSIENIESDLIYDRQILANMAYHQWHHTEISSGKAWKELQELYG